MFGPRCRFHLTNLITPLYSQTIWRWLVWMFGWNRSERSVGWLQYFLTPSLPWRQMNSEAKWIVKPNEKWSQMISEAKWIVIQMIDSAVPTSKKSALAFEIRHIINCSIIIISNDNYWQLILPTTSTMLLATRCGQLPMWTCTYPFGISNIKLTGRWKQ